MEEEGEDLLRQPPFIEPIVQVNPIMEEIEVDVHHSSSVASSSIDNTGIRNSYHHYAARCEPGDDIEGEHEYGGYMEKPDVDIMGQGLGVWNSAKALEDER